MEEARKDRAHGGTAAPRGEKESRGDASSPQGEALAQAIAIMARLRGEDGCAWDRAQSFDTIKRHTLEETYEVFDAIERRDWVGLKEELGDLLLQVLFYARMAEEAGYFNIEEVAETLNAKLVRRHPHIFGDRVAGTPEEVARNWEAIKREERAGDVERSARFLDAVKRHAPALREAEALGARAAEAGFDWPEVRGLLDKLAEETAELKAELASERVASAAVEEELGDVLFTAVQMARHLKLDPEFALRGANAKFRRRFGALEARAGGAERLREASAEELEAMWGKVKTTDG